MTPISTLSRTSMPSVKTETSYVSFASLNLSSYEAYYLSSSLEILISNSFIFYVRITDISSSKVNIFLGIT